MDTRNRRPVAQTMSKEGKATLLTLLEKNKDAIEQRETGLWEFLRTRLSEDQK